jgi:polysaccharide pyruvyl transferase WcaK-like protein
LFYILLDVVAREDDSPVFRRGIHKQPTAPFVQCPERVLHRCVDPPPPRHFMNLIAPFGFYGWGNIGDESTLQGFARLVRGIGTTSAWIGSQDPAHCREAEPRFRYFQAAAGRSLRRRWAWILADAMVVPGGTPISDTLGNWPLSELEAHVRRAAARGLPIAFVGTGTESLRRSASRALVAQRIAPSVRHWTVRSERDRERLIAYGVAASRVSVAADLAWHLDGVPAEDGRRRLDSLGVPANTPLLGVNVNDEDVVRTAHPVLLGELAVAIDAVIEQMGAHVVFLCNEVREGATFDRAASLRVRSLMRRPERVTLVPNEYFAPQQMLSLIACCRWTLSTRYHFCLFSAVQGVPFLAIERSDKVADLCADLAWPATVPLTAAAAPRILEVATEMEANHQTLVAALSEAVERMRTRSAMNRVALAALRA